MNNFKNTVTFKDVVQIKYMHVWLFAHNKYRQRYWENVALDRVRFRRRIDKFEQLFVKVCKYV